MKKLLAVAALVAAFIAGTAEATPHLRFQNFVSPTMQATLCAADTAYPNVTYPPSGYAMLDDFPDSTGGPWYYDIYVSCSKGLKAVHVPPYSAPDQSPTLVGSAPGGRTIWRITTGSPYPIGGTTSRSALYRPYDVVRSSLAQNGVPDTMDLVRVDLLIYLFAGTDTIPIYADGTRSRIIYKHVQNLHESLTIQGPPVVQAGTTFDVWASAVADSLNTGISAVWIVADFDSTLIQTGTPDLFVGTATSDTHVGCVLDGSCSGLTCNDVFFVSTNTTQSQLFEAAGHHCWGQNMASSGALIRTHLKLRATVAPGATASIHFTAYAWDHWHSYAIPSSLGGATYVVQALDSGGGEEGGGGGEMDPAIALRLNKAVEWYDVAGRKLSAKPTGKGIYFVRLAGHPESKRVVVK